MKFGDKLIQLRKKNNLSQEELAEKLGVSRQSVSKWESNNTYPETDKIVQICNIFECSMDDLINDKITNVDETLRKNKSNLNYVFDSLLEFITDTVNMFSKMSFASGLKCMIEMAVVAFVLFIISNIFTSVVTEIIRNLFNVFGGEVVSIANNITNGISTAFCFVISCIVLIHTFKIRYLNYIEDANGEKKSDDNNNNNSNNKEENNNNKKIIIRDEKDKPFAFLGIFSKIVICFIKFIAASIGLSFAGTLIGLVVALVVCICFIPTHIMFFGGTLGLISSCVIVGLFIMLIIYFIFEKKVNIKLLVIIFLSSLCLLGVGIGISTISLKNIKFIDKRDPDMYEMSKIDFNYEDNLVVRTNIHDQELHLIIDESLEGNKMIAEMETAKGISNIESSGVLMNDKMPTIYFYDNFNGNFPEVIRFFSKDLKKNQLHINYSGSDNVINIYANSDTLNKLIENTKKLYLIEVTEEDGYRKLKEQDDRVYIDYRCGVTYDAINDVIEGNDDNRCNVTYKDTAYGQKMYINCSDTTEENIENEINSETEIEE